MCLQMQCDKRVTSERTEEVKPGRVGSCNFAEIPLDRKRGGCGPRTTANATARSFHSPLAIEIRSLLAQGKHVRFGCVTRASATPSRVMASRGSGERVIKLLQAFDVAHVIVYVHTCGRRRRRMSLDRRNERFESDACASKETTLGLHGINQPQSL